jgi:sulfite reductase (ferredoxin)
MSRLFITLIVAVCTLLSAVTSLRINGYSINSWNPNNVLLKKPLQMADVAEKVEPAAPVVKLPKVEGIKQRSNYLYAPLQEELKNEEIFISPDAVVVMKYHGSYMQDDRDKRAKGVDKKYQFMLRLKSPAGEIPPELYLKLDKLCDQFGQGDLRVTTRQAFQLHGIMKGDLKTVISTINEAGSSTVGACGDVSRNVMTPAAPFVSPAYRYARQYSKVRHQRNMGCFCDVAVVLE